MNIMLVEDQALVRGALSALLSMEEGFNVVAECEDGKVALEKLKDVDVDLLLTDIEMPNMSGIELLEKIHDQKSDLKKVIVTTFGKAGYIKRALAAGAHGFLLKDAPSDALAKALRDVMAGKKVIDSELALSALDDLDPLSEKERKSLRLASEGKKTKEIAEALFLSEGTVRNYLSEAISKLNATNRIDAARIAKQKGWL